MKNKSTSFAALLLVGLFFLTSGGLKAKPVNKMSSKRSGYKTPYRAKHSLADVNFKNVQFAFNKTTIPANSYSELNRVANLVKSNNASVKLGGYADKTGGYVYNWKLSKARADAVKTYMVSKGADSSRIAATEYGYTKPIASNKTRSGRKKNRRVEIQFVR